MHKKFSSGSSTKLFKNHSDGHQNINLVSVFKEAIQLFSLDYGLASHVTFYSHVNYFYVSGPHVKL